MSFRVFLACLVVVPLVLVGCGERPDTARIDGSSTVFPITRAALDAYLRTYPDRRAIASSSGTAAGFQRFLRGETDVNNASRPIRPDELNRAEEAGVEFIELPIAFDGIAIVVNHENDWIECLTVTELKEIWERDSQVYQWSDIEPSFPEQDLRLYGRSPASGTFDYFTETINKRRGNIRDDYNASDTDNAIVQGVSRDIYGMAFFGIAYYEQNKDQLKLVALDNEQGNGCVIPSAETIQNATYQPLARPEFMYVNAERAGSPEVEPFITFFLEGATTFVPQAGYVPFSAEVYAEILERFDERTTGSLFEDPNIPAEMGVVDRLRLTDSIEDDAEI